MNRTILRLAVPNIVSNISVPLLGLVDLALMGHLESADYIGAISWAPSFSISSTGDWGSCAWARAVLTAQAYGRGDGAEALHTLGRAALIALVLGVLLVLLQGPVEWLSFALLQGEPRVEELAIRYFRIRIWAAPAVLGQFALLGYFLGMQNARQPMVVLVTTNVINILFSWLFVVRFHMGSDGVALGTVIAQYSGWFLALAILRRSYRDQFVHWSFRAVRQARALRRFLQVNRDIFIRTMCLVAVFTVFTARSAKADATGLGEDTILAVNSLLLQFFLFFSFLIDGFAYAAEALTGRYTGAADPANLRKVIRLLFWWGGGIAVFFTLAYLWGGEAMFRVLTDNAGVIQNARPYFFWVVLVPLLSFAAFLWDGIYIGATAGAPMRNAMLASTLVVFLPAYLVAGHMLGNHGLWLAFLLFMASRGIGLHLLAGRAIYGPLRVSSPASGRARSAGSCEGGGSSG
ncbi:MAG: MATE family efflux transporter [Bacteroidales bacterium]